MLKSQCKVTLLTTEISDEADANTAAVVVRRMCPHDVPASALVHLPSASHTETVKKEDGSNQ